MSGLPDAPIRPKHIFIQRVVLQNYKSIPACDVALDALTFLVGPNGAGKSNFLDGLRFISEAIGHSLDFALRQRGGINEVRRRSSGHPNHFGVRIEFQLPTGATGYYAFRVGAAQGGSFQVQQEDCSLNSPDLLGPAKHFKVRDGVVVSAGIANPPPASSDRLYLVNVSGFPEFRDLYECLRRMGFYSLTPEKLRANQPPDQGDLLSRDGGNITSVLRSLGQHHPALKQRIEQYLEKVVPGLQGVDVGPAGAMETLEFRQEVKGAKHPWRFYGANMSDGTLRALGVLTAIFQGVNGRTNRIFLVGIEEPEVALHPAATGILLDALKEASRQVQILVTSHSPDLLDTASISGEALLAVDQVDGATRIAPLDEAGRSTLRDRLYTAGELLRMNRLQPDPVSVPSAEAAQLMLFNPPPGAP